MSPPPSPRYAANYEPSFDGDRQTLGFSAENFEALFRRVEFEICDDPWLKYSEEVPESDGMRILSTREAFPDIPSLYVYYRFNADTKKVDFFGLSPAWSQSETF